MVGGYVQFVELALVRNPRLLWTSSALGSPGRVKNSRDIMEILEAYDLTGSYRATAELTGCDHRAVARYVQIRAAGRHPDQRRHQVRAIEDYLPKIEELVVRSQGKIRADVVHSGSSRWVSRAGNAPPPAP